LTYDARWSNNGRQPDTHWLDQLPPGVLGAQLNLLITADAEQWARDHDIPPEQAREAFEAFEAFVEQVRQEAAFTVIRAGGACFTDLRTPH
jgi:hypothetical protein